jgi:FkbM family methyltransferase
MPRMLLADVRVAPGRERVVNIFTRLYKTVRYPRKRSYALNQLDLKLLPYVKRWGGFFIEAGANDGRSQSNTWYLEKYYGWKGILVEPIPALADQCRRNRPGSIVENCALVPFGHAGLTVEMHYCNLMSLVKGAMKSEANDLAHIKAGVEVQPGVGPYDLQVPARTLTAVLDQHRPPRIDLLSLDVEGFELSVLRGLDFERYRPRLMLIEARFRDEIDAFLQSRYKPIATLSHHDILYQPLTEG